MYLLPLWTITHLWSIMLPLELLLAASRAPPINFSTQPSRIDGPLIFTPTIANLSGENFEIKFVYTYYHQPLILLRYIDDIFLIWVHSREVLHMFIQHLNEVHPTLKFTANISESSKDFLDTTVKVDTDHNLYTTLYTKPTDTYTYLHYTSAHPPYQKKSRPYSQLV